MIRPGGELVDARAMMYGNPLIDMIRTRGGVDPDHVVNALGEAFAREFGNPGAPAAAGHPIRGDQTIGRRTAMDHTSSPAASRWRMVSFTIFDEPVRLR
jgi:hypothetical protein